MLLTKTYHKSSPELVRLPDLGHDEGVQNDNEEVGDDLNQEKLGPEDVVSDIGWVASQVTCKHLILIGVIDQLKSK